MFFRKTCCGLFSIALLALPGSANANCWAEFERPGLKQFGYVLVFAVPTYGDEKPRFNGVVGVGDQLEYTLVSVEFSEREADTLVDEPPTILAIVGDVETLDNGLKSIRVRTVLRSLDEIEDAKEKSDSDFPGSCGSTFAAHWIAG